MHPLADVRIVSLEQYGAGPYATTHLAELGADIIKIEQPRNYDVGRYVPPFAGDDDSLFFQALNRSKRSVILDISAPQGRAVFDDLVVASDAVFSNLRGDVPAKLRIRYADLAPLNPAIVCCSLSGYGMTGPRAATPGFDYMIQGLSGWMNITGDPDGPPTKTGMSAVDFSSGLVAALATIVGIHAAQRDGRGMDCDIALLDTAMSMLTYLATWAGTRGYDPGRIPRSSHPTLVPFGNFPTKDGWIIAGGSKEKFWTRLATAVGRTDLLDDQRFTDFPSRLVHKDELITELDRVFATEVTAVWLDRLEAAQVPCAPVNSIGEALVDKQVLDRELVETVEHPVFGAVKQVRSPVRVGATSRPLLNAPVPGQDTRRVLSELLGYSASHIAELGRAGVIGGPGL
ncbi:MAG: hypothetical protein QOD39_2414 [Mycobacterium sp.]|nr:hypothetical protein [Mycobacterium sp.]